MSLWLVYDILSLFKITLKYLNVFEMVLNIKTDYIVKFVLNLIHFICPKWNHLNLCINLKLILRRLHKYYT